MPCEVDGPRVDGVSNPKKKKICCVCKETKSVRDECIVTLGEERCKAFIEAHNKCLKSEGFDIAIVP